MPQTFTFKRPLTLDDWEAFEAFKQKMEKEGTPFIVSTTQAYVKICVIAETQLTGEPS